MGEFTAAALASSQMGTLGTWVYGVAFSLQVYFDFSGYSDMAIGLGSMLGFKFPENFNYPFISKSVSEFWRRWHMTLGSWFRDYVYIPLGGNRVRLPRWLLNMLIVWLLTGFWHGAAWNYVVWGLYFALLLAVEKLFLGKLLDRLPAFVSRLYTLLALLVSFIIFGSESLSDGMELLRALFGAGQTASSVDMVYAMRNYAGVLLVALIGCTPLPKYAIGKLSGSGKVKNVLNVLEPAACAALLLVATAHLVDGSFNPFLYFRF